MPVVFSEKVDSILSVGKWLGPDLHTWALTREQAVAAITDLREANFIVLGGDVLNGPDKNYRHTYDSWYFQPSISLSPDDVTSSAMKAIDYVTDYPRDDVYFVVVPTKSLTALSPGSNCPLQFDQQPRCR